MNGFPWYFGYHTRNNLEYLGMLGLTPHFFLFSGPVFLSNITEGEDSNWSCSCKVYLRIDGIANMMYQMLFTWICIEVSNHKICPIINDRQIMMWVNSWSEDQSHIITIICLHEMWSCQHDKSMLIFVFIDSNHCQNKIPLGRNWWKSNPCGSEFICSKYE